LERIPALALKKPKPAPSGLFAFLGALMFQLDVRHNIDDVLRRLSERRKSIPVATANALNATVFAIRDAQVDEMKRVFDRPTRYTLNALFIYRATADKLVAKVWLKESYVGLHYLRPEIFGGPRVPKNFELVLRSRGILPAGMFAVPGTGAKLDAFGNMSRGQLGQVMSALQAAEHVAGFSANRTVHSIKRRRGKLPQFFVGTPGHGLPLGVWQSIRFARGSAVKPILLFVRQPVYAKRFDFYGVGNRIADTTFARRFEEEAAGSP
jgi:hypothetical protein